MFRQRSLGYTTAPLTENGKNPPDGVNSALSNDLSGDQKKCREIKIKERKREKKSEQDKCLNYRMRRST